MEPNLGLLLWDASEDEHKLAAERQAQGYYLCYVTSIQQQQPWGSRAFSPQLSPRPSSAHTRSSA